MLGDRSYRTLMQKSIGRGAVLALCLYFLRTKRVPKVGKALKSCSSLLYQVPSRNEYKKTCKNPCDRWSTLRLLVRLQILLSCTTGAVGTNCLSSSARFSDIWNTRGTRPTIGLSKCQLRSHPIFLFEALLPWPSQQFLRQT